MSVWDEWRHSLQIWDILYAWGSQSMQDLASLMRKGRTFLIPDANSCIDCEPHKGWPRFAMNASIHLTHSFAYSAFSMDFLPPYRVWKSPKSETNFWKECIKAKKIKDTNASKVMPINTVHSSAMHYQNLIIIHECSKKLLKMKNNKSFFKHLVHTFTCTAVLVIKQITAISRLSRLH